VQTLRGHRSPAVLMQGHGVLTIGPTARDAVKAAVMCEDVAKTVHLARQLGKPVPIPATDVDALYVRYQTLYGQPTTTDGKQGSPGPLRAASPSNCDQAAILRRRSSVGSHSSAGRPGRRDAAVGSQAPAHQTRSVWMGDDPRCDAMTGTVEARLVLDPTRRVAELDRRLFGSFVEHMGRCVYTGIYEPGHATADEDGFRVDVLDLVRELGVSTIRYPGGNFVSGYRWEDGVGPRSERPVRRDPAWRSTETNEIGLDEFMIWSAKAGVETMLAVNLGTRGVQEALDLLEYATHPGGTTLSQVRMANGGADPYPIGLWCLGNEMDGPWQTGHKTAAQYARLAAETARAMRQVQDGLELVACGSSSSSMPTFGAWEATVLEETYDLVDMISAHAYYEERDGDVAGFLASGVDMDYFIDSVVATADHVGAKLGRTKRIGVSFDEWNVWNQTRFQSQGPPSGWPQAPRVIEDQYTVTDAVVVGGLLISLLRHSDRVQAACLAQLVNVIAPIMTEPGGPAWRQTIFHPFAQAARHCSGDVLDVAVSSPRVETVRFGAVPAVDAVATHDGDRTTVLAVNRSADAAVRLSIDTRPLGRQHVVACTTLADADRHAANTMADPDRVRPRDREVAIEGEELVLALPPVSWTVVRTATAGGGIDR